MTTSCPPRWLDRPDTVSAGEGRSVPCRRASVCAAVLLAAFIVPATAQAQQQIVQGLTWDRVLFWGSPKVLERYEAQTRFTLDAGFVPAVYQTKGERVELSRRAYSLLFDWDVAFNIEEGVDIGARFQFSYLDSANLRWLGPEMAGVAIRFAIADGTSGPAATIGVGVGQVFRDYGGTRAELEAVIGFEPHETLRLDLEGGAFARVVTNRDNLYQGAFNFGPVYRPVSTFAIALDAGARLGNQWLVDELFWDVRLALRLGLDINKHEVALSARRTLAGAWVDEETAVMLTWRIRWMTEEGFLRLDEDGGPPPEPPEWEVQESMGDEAPAESDVESDEEAPAEESLEPESESEPDEEIPSEESPESDF